MQNTTRGQLAYTEYYLVTDIVVCYTYMYPMFQPVQRHLAWGSKTSSSAYTCISNPTHLNCTGCRDGSNKNYRSFKVNELCVAENFIHVSMKFSATQSSLILKLVTIRSNETIQFQELQKLHVHVGVGTTVCKQGRAYSEFTHPYTFLYKYEKHFPKM